MNFLPLEIENMIIDLKDNRKYFIFHGDILDVFITKYKLLSIGTC
jgi:UDP-2,3-diacylglucosamine pyrophosphatase LpxH